MISAESVSGKWFLKARFRELKNLRGKKNMYIRLLTQIKNAQATYKERMKFPYSNMTEKVLEVLKNNKFILNFEKKGRAPKKFFDIWLLYKKGVGAINGVKLISRPSRRIYKGYNKINSVRQGYGMGVISTSQGIMTSKEAKKNKVGGQMLFEIW